MPSNIRGADDFDSFASKGLGDGQTWQDVSGSRSEGVVYTNTTGRAIAIAVKGTNNTIYTACSLTVDGIDVTGSTSTDRSSGGGAYSGVFGIVPDGSTYQIDIINAGISGWVELR